MGYIWHISMKTYHFILLPSAPTFQEWTRLTKSKNIAPLWYRKHICFVILNDMWSHIYISEICGFFPSFVDHGL